MPAIGFAIIKKQNHIVQYLLNECPQLNKSVFGLRTPIIISVKVGNNQCTKWMLDKLGGVHQALRVAEENGLNDLSQHIQEFMFTSGSEVSTYKCLY